jgi:hypothetical protein
MGQIVTCYAVGGLRHPVNNAWVIWVKLSRCKSRKPEQRGKGRGLELWVIWVNCHATEGRSTPFGAVISAGDAGAGILLLAVHLYSIFFLVNQISI